MGRIYTSSLKQNTSFLITCFSFSFYYGKSMSLFWNPKQFQNTLTQYLRHVSKFNYGVKLAQAVDLIENTFPQNTGLIMRALVP